MSENVIPIEQFEAEYKCVYDNGKVEWLPCTVVGVTYVDRWSDGQFITIIEGTDGLLYPYSSGAVRKPETYYPRRPTA